MKKGTLFSVRSLCWSAMIAAVYAALTLLLQPISYGPLQCRISEMLTMLAAILPQAIPGLTVGCLIANLLSPVGLPDILFGTLATLLAAIGTWKLKEHLLPATLCPILSNGLIIGAVLAWSYHISFLITALEVAAGEAVAVALGCLLVYVLKKNGALDHIQKLGE